MSNPDRSARVVAFGIALAIVGMIFASVYARASTFDERFTGAPKSEAPLAESWGIKLLLLIDGKVARAAPYDEEVYPSSDACKEAVIANVPLQLSAQVAAKLAVENFGATAAVGIACAMQLD